MALINNCTCGATPKLETSTSAGVITSQVTCQCGATVRNSCVASSGWPEDYWENVTVRCWNANHPAPVTEPTKVAADTRRFAIHSTLVNHCGAALTPDRIDQITNELIIEMTEGGCAWAFKE